METPALSRAGASGRCTQRLRPRWGLRFGPRLVSGSLNPPKSFSHSSLTGMPCPGVVTCTAPHHTPACSSPHPSLLGAIPRFIKRDLEVQSWPQHVCTL